MKVMTSIVIETPISKVWQTIIDIEHCADWISNIRAVDILDKPTDGFVGFKWKETRIMFGKEASETMWVTESVENAYYITRAESHGSIYISKIEVASKGDVTELRMSFSGEAQSIITKILSGLMSVFIAGSIKKALDKDLNDIKQYVEGR